MGQTATGKSDVAVELAQRIGDPQLNGIISADAYQLYRGMDIGTAKQPVDQRGGIEHFQLDVLDISEEASVAAYQRDARGDATTIERRGGTVLMAGGSGLYVRAVTDDLQFPGTDPELRAALHKRAQDEGIAVLHRELAACDPTSAARIPVDNERRVIRALEVYQLTGRPFSATLPRYEYVDPWIQIGIRWSPDILRQRIDARSRLMFRRGWLDEIDRLVKQGFEDAPTASRAVGYPQALDAYYGRTSIDEAATQVADATYKLTKKQWKWFKRDPRIHWITVEDAATSCADITRRAIDIIADQSQAL